MRLGGFAAIALVFLGAFMRMWVPQTPALAPVTMRPKADDAPAASVEQKTEQKRGVPSGKVTQQTYPVGLKERIRDFYGHEHSSDSVGEPPCLAESLDYWCVPKDARGKVRFLIATVPDPIHSHLSLFFDRSIDTIVEGLKADHYLLDRALMPWHYLGDSTNESADQVKLRESFPGLMIFRGENGQPPVFVLTVGETPTAGINQEQFHYAFYIIRAIRAKTTMAPSSTTEFGILGPTFQAHCTLLASSSTPTVIPNPPAT